MRIFIHSLLIVLCFLDTSGKTCELPIEAREILRAYQRGILKKVEEARKKLLSKRS